MTADLAPALADAGRVDLFRSMVLIRTFEDAILREYHADPQGSYATVDSPVPGELRLSAGREPVAAGVCAHLDNEDAVTASHRPPHLAVAHGVDLRKLAGEILGRERPRRGARTDRWHLFDPDTQFTSSGTIAEGYPPALGRAFAFQQRKTGRVAVTVTDNTAAHEEGFREAVGLASLWRLPLVFVIEDDDWGGSAPRTSAHATTGGVDRIAATYGIPGERVEDNAVESIYAAAGRAVGRARAGDGPSVVEVHTVRLFGPVGDDVQGYLAGLYGVVGVDPVPTYEMALRERGLLDDQQVAQIQKDAADRVGVAIADLKDQVDPAAGGGFPTRARKAVT